MSWTDDLNGRQSRCLRFQRRHRYMHSRRDNTAEILPVFVHNAQGGCSAEIYDEQVPARKSPQRAYRVSDLIGTNLQWVVISDLQAGFHSRLQQERLKAEIFPEAVSERVYGVRRHRTDS